MNINESIPDYIIRGVKKLKILKKKNRYFGNSV